jgi:G-protein signaling modulator 2
MEQLDLIKMTPDNKKQMSVDLDHVPSKYNENYRSKPKAEDDFFDLLTKFQSKRMDDQRCTLKVSENGSDTESNRKPLVQHNNQHLTKDSR